MCRGMMVGHGKLGGKCCLLLVEVLVRVGDS